MNAELRATTTTFEDYTEGKRLLQRVYALLDEQMEAYRTRKSEVDFTIRLNGYAFECGAGLVKSIHWEDATGMHHEWEVSDDRWLAKLKEVIQLTE